MSLAFFHAIGQRTGEAADLRAGLDDEPELHLISSRGLKPMNNVSSIAQAFLKISTH
ncbi:hypothetical protein [Sinorhizobium meliloti]|uniref:hypothetical protein n=1 Tax=Rhizobium meliloti TaxID=382 RepID=UPI0030CFD47A